MHGRSLKGRCIESRFTPEGFKRRRYERTDGTRHTTIEIPLDDWAALNKLKTTLYRRAQLDRMKEKNEKIKLAIAHHAEGWKAYASAHELGVHTATIRRWRQKAAK